MVVRGAELSQVLQLRKKLSWRAVIGAIGRVAALGILLKWLCQVAQLRLRLWGPAGGPWPLPLIGTVGRLLKGGLGNMHKTSLQDVCLFGNMHAWAYFHKPMVNTNCPFHLRRMLVTHWKRYDRSDFEQAAFGELLGQGLILVGNDGWKDMRQLYQSGFNDRNILDFRKVLHTWSHDFVTSLLAAGKHGSQPVDIQEAVQKLTFRAIGLFTLGVDFESEPYLDDLQKTMGSTCSNYGELWFQLLEHTQLRVIFGPFRWWKVLKTASVRTFEKGHALLLRGIDRAIDGRAFALAADPTERKGAEPFHDLLSCMVGQKGKRFSREEIRHQALTFLFAGHDTTTNLIAWCLYLLVTHPVMLEQARATVRQGDMQFLRCCLLETLRMYPSVPLRSRTMSQADAFPAAEPARCPMLRTPGAVSLPSGTGVSFAINAVHRDPEHWPEPEVFKPSRFEAHVAKAPSALLTAPWASEEEPLKYLPFGAGPRRCIGERLALLEAEEICCAVLKRCKLQAAAGLPPVDEMQLTMRARDGIHLLLVEDLEVAG
ncbi:unnamed protein product [Polarella glacialis]|uniref:Cytochrome P450 n=1 Tax=Polarella glacialis TaxID=89957 RepID=A0A813GDY8_POLGL|nr:unnamed protein product [Polarella glacialis]